jgi:signal peptidase II
MAQVGRPARVLAIAGIVLSTIGCDRVTKQIASQQLARHPRLSMAGDSVRLEYAENRGGFLSIGSELPESLRTVIFSIGTSALLAWLGVWVCRRVLGGGWAFGPALLWAGGVANVADRIARGSVVDFLNLGVGGLRTGIFNAADVAITVGVVLVACDMTRRPRQTRLVKE